MAPDAAINVPEPATPTAPANAEICDLLWASSVISLAFPPLVSMALLST